MHENVKKWSAPSEIKFQFIWIYFEYIVEIIGLTIISINIVVGLMSEHLFLMEDYFSS